MVESIIEEWKKKSEKGDVCGILFCENKPTVKCSYCGNWYCKDHSLIHFHKIEDDNYEIGTR